MHGQQNVKKLLHLVGFIIRSKEGVFPVLLLADHNKTSVWSIKKTRTALPVPVKVTN